MTFLGVGEWLARRSELTPAKIGLVDGETGARYTWQTLNLRARALATLLRERYAVAQGDRVAVLALNAPEYLDAFYASALLGAILVPLNWRLTPTELAALLGDSAPKVVLADERYADTARDVAAQQPGGMAALPFADFPGADEALAARAVPFTTMDGEEPTLLLYTSGTTGAPKGALLSHRMMTWNAINTQVSWGVRDDDITPTFAPLFHAGGLNVLTTPLAHCGGTVVLLRSSEPEAVLRCIAAEHCTIVFAVPTVFQRIMEHPAFETTDWSSVRFCVTGGSSCPLPVIERYAARGLVFRQGYGLTEVGVNCFSLAPEDALRKAGSVGQPVSMRGRASSMRIAPTRRRGRWANSCSRGRISVRATGSVPTRPPRHTGMAGGIRAIRRNATPTAITISSGARRICTSLAARTSIQRRSRTRWRSIPTLWRRR